MVLPPALASPPPPPLLLVLLPLLELVFGLWLSVSRAMTRRLLPYSALRDEVSTSDTTPIGFAFSPRDCSTSTRVGDATSTTWLGSLAAISRASLRANFPRRLRQA